MDADDRKLFEDSLRRLAEDRAGASLDPVLTEIGWSDAYADEPRLAVSLLFEQLGASNATSDALGHVIAAAASIELEPDVAVVLPSPGGYSAPGTMGSGTCTVDGRLSSAAADTAHVAVITAAGADHRVVTLPIAEFDVDRQRGIDPGFGLVAVRTRRPVAVDQGALADWPAAVAAAQLALSHQLLGTSRAMLRLAREHAVGRVQFDRAIAGFQAVRHRLADSLVAIQSADAAVTAAWAAPSSTTAMFAKALAGRAARTTARHAQQVLGAMGFTNEHPLHGYVRRSLVLDDLFGSSRSLVSQIGGEALRHRRLPDMVPLWIEP
jgi:hypothetical protein